MVHLVESGFLNILQFEALRRFMENGGSLMFMAGEGGEAKSGTNINYFLEEFGMVVNNDSVVSTVYRGSNVDKDASFVHPKACELHLHLISLLLLCGSL